MKLKEDILGSVKLIGFDTAYRKPGILRNGRMVTSRERC